MFHAATMLRGGGWGQVQSREIAGPPAACYEGPVHEFLQHFGCDAKLSADQTLSFLANEFVRTQAEFVGLSAELTAALLRAADTARRDASLRRLVADLYQNYCRQPMPTADEVWRWPVNSQPLPADAALSPALVVLACVPALRDTHRQRGIPEQVTRDTLQDIEVWCRTFRRANGYWGLQNLAWLTWHLRGELVRLGRLQFKCLPFPGPRFPKLAPGDLVIDIHIPEGGPMDFDACGDSLRQAIEFLPKHFPTPSPPVAFYCCSWFLDPQYAQILPAHSNIVRFLREFQLYPVPSDDREAFRRVFGEVPKDLTTAPRDTALRRAMLDFKLAGGQLRYCAGFKLLDGWRWG